MKITTDSSVTGKKTVCCCERGNGLAVLLKDIFLI